MKITTIDINLETYTEQIFDSSKNGPEFKAGFYALYLILFIYLI